MNRWAGTGWIKTKIQITYTQTGTCRVSFLLAVPRCRGETGEVDDYIPVIAWGRVAEDVRDLADQGARIGIDGHLQTSSWGDPRKYKTEVVADFLDFLDRREPVDINVAREEVDNDN